MLSLDYIEVVSTWSSILPTHDIFDSLKSITTNKTLMKYKPFLKGLIIALISVYIGMVIGGYIVQKTYDEVVTDMENTAETCIELYIHCNQTLERCVNQLDYFNRVFLNHIAEK